MRFLRLVIFLIPGVFSGDLLLACSMCKITAHGRTIVGNNEDAWRADSRIWFERGNKGSYGAVYVGHSDGFPQGGMNEAGLAYDGFTVYPRILAPVSGKPLVNNAANFLKTILKYCKSVEDVRTFVNQYDRRIFNRGMLLFADKSGKYLVVEADTAMEGNDPTYLLANFCPSQTSPDQVTIARYQRGRQFVSDHPAIADISYCTQLMDTMHECRRKIGDGTTYTSIYDLCKGEIYLYFYHDYNQVVHLNLHEELKKPDHVLKMVTLFRSNAEYESFVRYITPFNTPLLQAVLPGLSILLAISFMMFSVWSIGIVILKKPTPIYGNIVYFHAAIAFLNVCLAAYLLELTIDQAIYYFDAPYHFDQKSALSALSYIPPVLTLFIIPEAIAVAQQVCKKEIRKGFKIYLSGIFMVHLFLLYWFGYWKLLNVF